MFQVDIEELRRVLKSKGIQLDDLAVILGIDRSTLYRRIKENNLRIVDMHRIVEACSLTNEEACRIFLAQRVA